jgi:hypothetical protein
MKKILLALFMLSLFIFSKAQVKIGSNPSSINSSSLLELESSSKGLLIPRLTTAQMNLIANPTTGLLIFNSSDSHFYTKLDTGWTKLQTGENNWANSNSDAYNTNTGNIGIGTSTPLYKLHIAGDARIDSSIYLPSTTSTNTGVIYKDGAPFLHTAGNQIQQNVYLGKNAGSFNTIAKKNVAIGEEALALSDGADNVAIGFWAAHTLAGGEGFTDSYKNVFVGYLCGQTATGGINNVAVGNEAGYMLASGSNSNVLLGSTAGRNVTTGSGNVLIGNNVQSSTGSFNSGVGSNSGTTVSTGAYNTWMGTSALQFMRSGGYNTALGANAGRDDTTGNFNLYLGAFAGINKQGYNNVFIGPFAASAEPQTTMAGQLVINNSTSTTHLINGDFSTGKVGIKKTLADLNYTLDVGGEIRVGSLPADPVSSNGLFYYNTTRSKFTAYENGAWKDIINENKVKSKAGDPNTSDIQDGYFHVWKNTSSGNIYLWVNDGGVMKKIQFQ